MEEALVLARTRSAVGRRVRLRRRLAAGGVAALVAANAGVIVWLWMLGGGIYPGMITATIGTAMLLAVVATSLVIVRRRLSYEWWYVVHLLAYAGIALSWFHEIPTGNELVLDHTAADYWRALYVATL